MATLSQHKAFAEEMQNQVDEITMSNSTLDAAIEWICGNLFPEEVFSEKDLKTWAENNGYAEKE